MKTVVVYHADCPDGSAAAWVAHAYLARDITYFPRHYSDSCDAEIVEASRDCVVYYLDFSTSRQNLKTLARTAHAVYVIDHHKTARDELTTWDDKPFNCHIIFDMNRCGAMLAYDYLVNPGYRGISEYNTIREEIEGSSAYPRITNKYINYVQDRDLYKWELPDSRAVSAWIGSHPKTIDASALMNNRIQSDFGTVVREGEAILRFQQQRVDSIVKHAGVKTLKGPNNTLYTVPCVNTASFISEVGEALLAANPDAPFVAMWFTDAKGFRIWSLRVSVNSMFDASAVAKHHGGGGHQRACGWLDSSNC